MENVYVGHLARAAVHLGKDYLENAHSIKNQSRRTMKQLLDVTQKLVSEQTQIHGISLIKRQDKSWETTTLLNDRAVQLSTAKQSPRILQFSLVHGKNS